MQFIRSPKFFILASLLVFPILFNQIGMSFYLDLATRLCILAIAAVGLNLILGYGGMISFGHAAYLGLGAYAVGIPAQNNWRLFYNDNDGIFTNGILSVCFN